MTEIGEPHRNRALWLGFVFALVALLCNAAFFISPPVQEAIPWISLVVAIVALIFLVKGVIRFFAEPGSAGRRTLRAIGTLLSLLLIGVTIFSFVHARELPASTEAPKVGDKAPEFTLSDSTGQPVSLAQLFEPAAGEPQTLAPKAVLLIFYRGYW